MGSMAFLLMCLQDRDTDDGPPGWRCAIARTESLEFHLDAAAGKISQVTICSAKEVFHLLNGCEHGLIA